jgi:cysteine sulfinate desulfinase/cysteine desulfurase-like protein
MLPQIEASKKLIYLDNAATTPLEPDEQATVAQVLDYKEEAAAKKAAAAKK